MQGAQRRSPFNPYPAAMSKPQDAKPQAREEAIKKAFETQLEDKGFSLVEVLSPCPTNWKMSPKDSIRWVDEIMTKIFPLKVIKDVA